jgi:hypothetical protein
VTVVDGSGGALAIPEDLDAFELRVATVTESGDDLVRFRRTVVLESVEESLPQSLSITPASNGTGEVRVTVLGLRSGRVVQRIERVAGFGIGRVELPEFALTPLCFGVVCPAGQSCESDGVCRDAMGVDDGGVPADAGPCGPLLVECADECVAFSDDNCGTCGNACDADERCVSNRCVCDVGTVACGDRCADLNSSLVDCGACDIACTAPNGTPVCDGGVCRVGSCDPGWADCNASIDDGCETMLGTMANCSACGEACIYPNGNSSCEPTGCVFGACNPGYEDCDGVRGSGCETRIDTVSNCGACGNSCDVARGSASCVGGTCRIASCNRGWGDCDGNYGNGCETALDSTTNCGACGRSCNPTFATGDCSSGTCQIAACNADRDDCNGNVGDGCETNIANDEGNCGSCGNTCGTNERCMSGTCACPNNGTWDDRRGPCLPSCGHLLNMTGSPRGGTSCCMMGCTTAVVGGFQASYDCNYCCEAPTGTNACL